MCRRTFDTALPTSQRRSTCNRLLTPHEAWSILFMTACTGRSDSRNGGGMDARLLRVTCASDRPEFNFLGKTHTPLSSEPVAGPRAAFPACRNHDDGRLPGSAGLRPYVVYVETDDFKFGQFWNDI